MSSIEDEIETQLLESPPFASTYHPPVIPGISLDLDDSGNSPLKALDEDDPSAAFFAERDNDDVPSSIRFQRGIPKRVPRVIGLVKEFALHAPKINSQVLLKDNGIITGWKDVDDLDSFLSSLYNYYTGNGYFCILSNQLTTLL